jgi:cephalosporin hydroxylase
VQRMLVVLDSDHSARHVLAELAAFAPLVPVGSYIHVQDGCIDEVDWYRESGRPGPLVAVKEFLVREKSFVRDLDVEQRYLSMVHPFGWLKRVTT